MTSKSYTKEDFHKEKKTKKIVALIIIVILVVSISSVYIFMSLSGSNEKDKDLQVYKKTLFDSVVCQYSCPLSIQIMENVSQLLPEKQCLIDCSKDLNTNYRNVNFTKQDMLSDSLLMDMETTVRTCLRNNFDFAKNKTNNQEFFICTTNDLKKLKNDYDYLK